MYDVIIVGAGPAGSSTAYNCAKRGLKVTLIDQRKKPGTPKQCAEGINEAILPELDIQLRPEWISREIDSIVFSNIKHHLLLRGRRTKGFVLNRKKFDYGLVERAEKAGTELKLGMKVIDLRGNKVLLGDKSEVEGKIIVGADGPLSTIGKKSGLGNPRCGQGIQYEITSQNTTHPNSLQIYMVSELEDEGYLWLFPKKETFNVGLGSQSIKNLKPALHKFVKEIGLENEKIQETNAGLIPLHGPVQRFYTENVLLVGDAAGHTNPFSGGGIPVAIFDGILAAEVIEKHLNYGYKLSNYQKLWWSSKFGKAVKACMKVEKGYRRLLNNHKLDLFFEKVDGIEVNAVKNLILVGLKIPGLLNKIRLFWMFRKVLKYYKYCW